MKTKDISEQVATALKLSRPPQQPWETFIDWKAIRDEGYTTVQIDGMLYTFTKYGLRDVLI